MIFDPNRMVDPRILIWIFMVMIYGFLEIGIGLRNRSAGPRKKVRDITFYAVTLPCMIAMYGAVVEAQLKNHVLPATWFGIGCLVLLSGIVLRITALFQLGRSFSTRVRHAEGQTLCTTGTYRFIRHPLYCATLLLVIGSGIMLHSIFVLMLLPFCTAGIMIRISKEERFMITEFPGYNDYLKKTKRLIPGIF